MSKKTVALIVVLALLVAGAAYVAVRLKNRGMDGIGVTTLTSRNMVIMNSKTGNEFIAGTGYFNVSEGERIRVEYDLSTGEIDLLFYPSAFSPPANMTLTLETRLEELDSAPADLTEESFFGQNGVSGKGNLYFDAAPGAYAVKITPHDSIGKAVITVKAG